MLLACLGMLGPFSIDTYLPAFPGIAQTLSASPLQLQQTLSAYLFGFAFMNLFHGALADSFGRRPVILAGVAVFALASIGCALAASPAQLIGFRALQGLATGAGTVVSRAVIRDMFPPADAQRVMSQVTLFFGVAPAVAPLVGGLLFVHAGRGELYCDFGHLAIEAGDYVVLPRGTMWRIETAGVLDVLMIEATNSSYQLPEKGLVGNHAIFDPAVLDTPKIDAAFVAQQSDQALPFAMRVGVLFVKAEPVKHG